MKAAKCKKLEADGWKVGSAAEFLNLSDEEVAYIELKLELAKRLKAALLAIGVTNKYIVKAFSPESCTRCASTRFVPLTGLSENKRVYRK